MKIKVDEVVLDREGIPCIKATVKKNPKTGMPILKEDGEPQKDYVQVTIRTMISEIVDIDEPSDTGEVRSKLAQIQNKLWDSNEPDFTVEQLSLIKERAGKFANVFTYGKIEELVEKKTE